jgi:antitoxin component YwqK of YwqJK toxin-antitoxin module
LKEGKWETYNFTGYPDEIGSYHLDKADGKWKYYYETGALKTETEYEMGKLSGTTINYYPSTAKQSITHHKIVKDKKPALTKANGKKSYTIIYVSKPHGTWTYYTPDGKVMSEITYKNGVKVQ